MTTLIEDQAKAANQGKAGFDALGNPIAAPATNTPTPITSTGTVDLAKVAAANSTAANNLSALTTTNTDPITASSAPVVAQENKTMQDVTSLASSNADSQAAHQAYLDQLAAESTALEQRRAAEAAGINASFDNQAQKTQTAQKAESGTFTSTLARIGGYLGDSASASGAIVNLNQQHTYQMQDLEAKRQSALQDAKNAIDDKSFALARAKAQEAKDYAKEIADNKQQFFQNKISLLNEQRAQDESNRAAIKDKLANLALVDPAKVSTDTKKQIDDFYGTPGFTDSYLAITNAANEAKTTKDLMDARKSTLDFLQNIPQGQKVKMPDGTEYTGMGKAGDVATFLQVDSSGTGHLITYNKLTGQKSISNVGIVGKASAPTDKKISPGIADDIKAALQIQLEGTKTGKYYDPDTYVSERKMIRDTAPQLLAEIDKQFLDKNNGYFSEAGIKRLRSKGIFYNDVGLPNDPAPATPTDQTGNDISVGQ